jgi:MFS family permease
MHLRPGALWRHTDFLKLWTGETVSLFGSQVTILALPLTAILTLHATAFQVASISAVLWAPYLCFPLVAGWWADNHPRRLVLIIADLGQAILLGLIPLLAFLHLLRIEYMYLISFLVGSLTVFFSSAYRPYLTTLVGRPHLMEGDSKLQVSESVAQIGGPGLGGVLVQLLTAPYAILIDACSFVCSALGLILIRQHEQRPETASSSEPVWRQMGAGFQTVFGNPLLRALGLASMTYNFFEAAINALFVLYATRELHLQPALLGTILAMGSIGALLGSLLATPLARRIGLGPALIFMSFFECVIFLLLPLAGGPLNVKIVLLILAFGGNGIGLAATNIYYSSLRQATIPDAVLGRALAANSWVGLGVVPVGAFLAGLVQNWLGLHWTILWSVIGLLSMSFWIMIPSVYHIHDLPTQERLEGQNAQVNFEGASQVLEPIE